MTVTSELPQAPQPPRAAGAGPLDVERINRHAQGRGTAVERVRLGGAIDRTRLFTCPTLAPLAHDPIFATLSPDQQTRYNQSVGLLQNELICFFEQDLAATALPALLRDRSIPPDLAAALQQFADDEARHTAMFRRLNRLAEPAWYDGSDFHILQLPGAFRHALRAVAARPRTFPAILWMMLLMEERSLMISRRYAAMDQERLDPQFAETYRAHAEDEVRHVQLDWHLLERFYESRPRWVRRANAKLLEWFVVGLFLKPRRANVRLVDLLIEDFPELAARRSELLAAVRNLANNPGYRRLMYSGDSTPIGRALFERLPEFARLRHVLYAEDGR